MKKLLTLTVLIATTFLTPISNSAQEQDTLRIATYNINGGNQNDNLEEIVLTITSSGAEVVLLQELNANQSQWLAQRLGMQVRFFSISSSGEGLAVLSYIEMVFDEGVVLSTASEHASALQRVQIQPDAGLITLYNVWLGQSVETNNEQQISENEQIERLDEIFRILGGDYPDGNFGRIVLGGTFNISPSTSSIQRLRDAGFQDPFTGSPETTVFTFQRGNYQDRFDYLWIRPPLQAIGVNVMDSQASDHRMVVTEVRLLSIVETTSDVSQPQNMITDDRGNVAIVFVGNDDRLYALDSDGSRSQVVSNYIAAPCFSPPEFSPNGRYLAFGAENQSLFEVMVTDLDTGVELTLGSQNEILLDFEWLPDSRRLMYVPQWETNSATDYPVEPQGIWTVDVETNERSLLIPPISNQSLTVPELSPNGQLLAFHEVGIDAAGENIVDRFIIGYADGSGIISSSIPAGLNFDWSPDSTQIVYDTLVSRQSTNLSLYISTIDGTSQRFLYDRDGYSASNPLWSPNGEYIAFRLTQDAATQYNSSLWVISPESYEVTEIPNSTYWNVMSWSSDSTSLLAVDTEGDGYRVGLLPIDGSLPTIFGQGRCASWQPQQLREYTPPNIYTVTIEWVDRAVDGPLEIFGFGEVKGILTYSIAVTYEEYTPSRYRVNNVTVSFEPENITPTIYCQSGVEVIITNQDEVAMGDFSSPQYWDGPDIAAEIHKFEITPFLVVGDRGEVTAHIVWYCQDALELVQGLLIDPITDIGSGTISDPPEGIVPHYSVGSIAVP